jgi:DNA-binding transcriptional MerR regulator
MTYDGCYKARMADDELITPRLYTSAETAHLSGNQISRIEFWTRLGILIPEQTATRGGTRLYSLYSVIEAARCGLLADRGLSSAQLQAVARTIRAKVSTSIRPEPDFDLHARAAYGFFIESVKGIRSMYGLSHDPVIKRFLRKAEQRHMNKKLWALTHLNSATNVAALVAGLTAGGDTSHGGEPQGAGIAV